jgi:hypothetical protein
MTLEDFHIDNMKKRRGMWPVWGLFLLLACLAVGRVLSPALYSFIRSRSPRFSIGTLSQEQVLWFLAVIIAVVLVSIVTLILAFSAPRKKSVVSEARIGKVRKEQADIKRAKKKRMLELNRKMREQNIKKSGS